MIFSLLNFPALVGNATAAAQASCKKLLNFTSGSVTRAVIEANASVGLWLQYLIVQYWQGTRLATSTGEDVDSFVGDFGLLRLPAQPATGTVVVSRFFTGNTALVPLGATVMTVDNAETFQVVEDDSNANWNPGLGGYLMSAGMASMSVLVSALVGGASGNVQQGSVGLLTTAVPGIDSVTNIAPFLNGADAESDASLKGRFRNFIQTRARATELAVEYAITTVQQDLSFFVAENTDTQGNFRPGSFVAVIDNGTGSPPSALISAVYAAIDAVRPIGSTFAVVGPIVTRVAVSLTISVGALATKNLIIPLVENAILDYIDALPIGATLPYSVIAKLAWDADPDITNVSAILINGATSDVAPGLLGVIRASTVSVT